MHLNCCGLATGFCEQCNESGDFTTQTKCLYWLSNCQFVKKAADSESRINVINRLLQQVIYRCVGKYKKQSIFSELRAMFCHSLYTDR
jgi:hypothetical protein